jgi:hypothetical protein
MNPLHQHAQELDGAFTAIGRRLDACENVDQIHAYLDELEAEIIERPYGDALHQHAFELAHIRINTLFYNSLKEAAK